MVLIVYFSYCHRVQISMIAVSRLYCVVFVDTATLLKPCLNQQNRLHAETPQLFCTLCFFSLSNFCFMMSV